jgi:hypothetical protein
MGNALAHVSGEDEGSTSFVQANGCHVQLERGVWLACSCLKDGAGHQTRVVKRLMACGARAPYAVRISESRQCECHHVRARPALSAANQMSASQAEAHAESIAQNLFGSP